MAVSRVWFLTESWRPARLRSFRSLLRSCGGAKDLERQVPGQLLLVRCRNVPACLRSA